MALNGINSYYGLRNFNKLTPAHKCTILNRAVSSLVYTARLEAAKECSRDPDKLTQEDIQGFLIEDKEYNAIDIGYIIKEFDKAAVGSKAPSTG